MKEIKDCKIIQDLLPNYIDGLTNEQTNEFIKNHLKECDDCPKILESMKKEVDLNVQKSNKQEVNYIKKFKTHLRTLQGILLVILLAFVIVTGRKTAILLGLKEKAAKYANSTNYYMRVSAYSFDSSLTTQTYRKGDQYKTLLGPHGSELMISYFKNGNYNIYYPRSDEPHARLNASDGWEALLPSNYFAEANIFELLQAATFSSITPERCNGKECYRVTFGNFTRMVQDREDVPATEEDLNNCIIYFNQKTGLPLRVIMPAGRNEKYDPTIDYGTDVITDYYYSFGTVTDKPFVEPDISEYQIIEEGED